ncbi:MAG: inositol monophosphatase family protein [bacterium]
MTKLSTLVRDIAREELLPRFAQVACETKDDNSIVTEADLAMQQRVTDALQHEWPDFGLLGEEMTQAEQEALIDNPGAGLWILDPLDGTNNYAAGIPYFSVSLALLQQGKISAALVYDPVRDECFTAINGQGASLNGEPLCQQGRIPPFNQCMAAIDFKRLKPPVATDLACNPPYGSQRSFGSVALDWCWLAANRFHLYLHGKSKLWDYVAGQLILSEAGGHSTTLQGEPVFTATMEPRSSVAALDEGLFQSWQSHLNQI